MNQLGNTKSDASGRIMGQFDERECPAIIEGINTQRACLSDKTFNVFTDYSALKWLQPIKHDTGRLSQYSYEIDTKWGC